MELEAPEEAERHRSVFDEQVDIIMESVQVELTAKLKAYNVVRDMSELLDDMDNILKAGLLLPRNEKTGQIRSLIISWSPTDTLSRSLGFKKSGLY